MPPTCIERCGLRIGELISTYLGVYPIIGITGHLPDGANLRPTFLPFRRSGH